ncbi:Transposase [Streptococcus mutans 15VF2]|nr:Transposase [Streptococcus mutans 15VF2]
MTENKLNREFQAEKPLEKLVTDITYLYFGSCKLYLSSIMDLYNHNREIVAYTISDCQDIDFVLDTLNQLELPRGAFYTVIRALFTPQKPTFRPAQKKSIIRSMFRKGTPTDNACIKWFHSVLKHEIFYLHNWRNLTKDNITDIVKMTSHFIMKLECNRN